MEIRIEMHGNTPLMMHNERLSDSTDQFTRRIKEITAKGVNQTDSDREEISRLEWYGGIYTDGDTGKVCVPSTNALRCLREAAAITREGKDVARSLSALRLNYALIIPGSSTKPDDLWGAPNKLHIDTRQVKVGRGRIPRTRPIFPQWGIVLEFELAEAIMNLRALEQIVHTAGRAVGLCDGRIIGFGRFKAKIVKAQPRTVKTAA